MLDKLDNLQNYNYFKIKSENINYIFDTCDDYDFVLVSTNINITSFRKKFCSVLINITDGVRQYFCSKKYFLCNNKIFNFNEIYICNHTYGFVCINKNYVLKYEENRHKTGEITKEIALLSDEKIQNYDFIKKQALLYYEETSDSSMLLEKKINMSILTKSALNSLGFKEKVRYLLVIMEQLKILEENGYLYCDLVPQNILFSNTAGSINIIDLGSYLNVDYLIKKHFLYNKNLLICLLTLVYNFFSNNSAFIHNVDTNFSLLRNINNYNIYIRYFIRQFFIFIEDNYNKATYTLIYNFFKKNIYSNNILNIKNIFINKYKDKND